MNKTLKVIIISVIALSIIWISVYFVVRYNNKKELIINNSIKTQAINWLKIL